MTALLLDGDLLDFLLSFFLTLRNQELSNTAEVVVNIIRKKLIGFSMAEALLTS